MLATQIEVSDGTLNTLNVGIEFFNQSDISVSLDQSETPLVLGVHYQWSAATTIQFLPSVLVPGGLVPTGVAVIIRRNTKDDEMYNIYDGGAPFSRLTLDENFEQLLRLSQEFSEGLGLDGLRNNLNMNGYRVIGLGDPQDPQDAAPKEYVDNTTTTGLSYTLRATDTPLDPIENASLRANRVLGFDNTGQPVATLPASGSGTELALALASPDGSELVGYKDGTVFEELDVQRLRTNVPFDIKSGANRSGIFAELIRTVGDSTAREIQDFCISPGSNLIYSTHHRVDDNFGIITRYPLEGDSQKLQQDCTIPDAAFGHQGLSVERLDNQDKLWITYGLNPHIAMRFSYAVNAGPSTPELFQLFDDVRFSPGSSCNPSISPDQRFISGFCLEFGTGKVFCRVWDFQKMLAAGPGDHTATWLYEFNIGDAYIPSTHPTQGHAISGNEIYFWSGGNGVSVSVPNRHLHTFTLDGTLITKNLIANIGRTKAASDGSGVSYEPEGMCCVQNGSAGLALMVGVRSGSSLNPSVFRIWSLGLGSPTVLGDTYITGNYQSSLANSTASGRDFLAVRSRSAGGASGAGVNYYGKDDRSTPYSINELTGPSGTVRRSVASNGQHTLQASSGVPTVVIDKPDSGRGLEFRRAGVPIGAFTGNTAAMTMQANNLNLRFGILNGSAVEVTFWEMVATTGALRPGADNTYTLGQASLRLSELFAATATINTSDARLKNAIESIQDVVLDAWATVDFLSYKFNDAVLKKGDASARVHFGVLAQSVQAAFEQVGLDPFMFSLLCHNSWEAEYEDVPAVYSESLLGPDGEPVELVPASTRLLLEAGDRYGVRYEEALVLEAALMRRTTKRLEERLRALESN